MSNTFTSGAMSEARFEELMVKVVDAIATPREEHELMSWLVDHPERALELDAHRALKATTDGWVDHLKLDLVEDAHRTSALSRAESGIGGALMVAGIGLLSGWGLVEAALDESAPLPIRAGIVLMAAGSAVLLFAVVRWRLRTHAHDPYTDVVR